MAIRMQIASVHLSPTCPRFLLMQIECREARMTQSRAVFVPAFAARRVSSTCFSATNWRKLTHLKGVETGYDAKNSETFGSDPCPQGIQGAAGNGSFDTLMSHLQPIDTYRILRTYKLNWDSATWAHPLSGVETSKADLQDECAKVFIFLFQDLLARGRILGYFRSLCCSYLSMARVEHWASPQSTSARSREEDVEACPFLVPKA
jgi:hypothetical protein